MISYEPLKKYMKDNKITAKKICELSGIREMSLSYVFHYKRIPRTDLIERICNALNCNIEDVIEWRPDEVQ